jgi:glycosyltransferase involved in cell wall biosynthesis
MLMQNPLVVLLMVSLVLELSMLIKPVWLKRQKTSLIYGALLSFLIGFSLVYYQGIILSFTIFVLIYRILNFYKLSRKSNSKIHSPKSFIKSSMWLGFAQLLTIGLICLLERNQVPATGILSGLVLFAAIFLSVILLTTLRNLKKSGVTGISKIYNDGELPSLTVAIPARNESSELTECLDSLLSSDYPKLEVIVYDDCSHNNASQIIKKFAHQGVRFIKGTDSPSSWLPKNYADHQLVKHSSGDYILFCGADVKFQRTTLRSFVSVLLSKDKTMACLLPINFYLEPSSMFMHPIRYWWELILPRRVFNRPPTISSCWIINKKFLNSIGGFTAVKKNIIPEGYFARKAVENDGYSFMRSGKNLEIQTQKSVSDQRETSIRIRYPQTHRRIEIVALITVIAIILIVVPITSVIVGITDDNQLLLAVGILCYLLASITQFLIYSATSPGLSIFSIMTYIPSLVNDIAITNESMLKYEFSNVEWKGRRVCLPEYEVVSELPK